MIKNFDIFKNWITEGVGDKYAEKNFPINPEFSDFENRYKSQKLIRNKEQIIFNDKKGFLLIKNPKSLSDFGSWVRGVIDKNGNLYLEFMPMKIHEEMLNILDDLYLIRYVDDWPRLFPTEYVSVQREGDKNLLLISESYTTMRPEEKRDMTRRISIDFWSNVSSVEEATPYFQKFLDKAKIKNPNINFDIRQIVND